jgi:hypothetical protein
VVFFAPTFGGLFLEHPNFEPANPMSTPEHIAPTWYFTPYYAILRAIPDQRLGALAFALSVLAFVFLPWLDRAKNKSIRYRGVASKILLGMFFVVFLTLMWLGLQPAAPTYVLLARICIPLYFAFFILLPFVSKADGNGRFRSSDLPCALSFQAFSLWRWSPSPAWLPPMKAVMRSGSARRATRSRTWRPCSVARATSRSTAPAATP